MIQGTEAPRLSVMVPNYNHGAYLPTALDAILQQSFPPSEIIVIDDGSTDNSWEVIKRYQASHPKLRAYRNERNLGIVPTLNRGIGLVQGNYFFPTAADDQVMPGLFEKSLRLLVQYPQAALCCAITEWRETFSGLNWHMAGGMGA